MFYLSNPNCSGKPKQDFAPFFCTWENIGGAGWGVPGPTWIYPMEVWYLVIVSYRQLAYFHLQFSGLSTYTLEDSRLEHTAITHLERKMTFQTSMILYLWEWNNMK